MTNKMMAVLAAARKQAARPKQTIADDLQTFVTSAIDDVRRRDYNQAVRWMEGLKLSLNEIRPLLDHQGELEHAIAHAELTKKLYETELILWAIIKKDEKHPRRIDQRRRQLAEVDDFLNQAVSISIGSLDDPAMAV